MKFSRRKALAMGFGGIAATMMPVMAMAGVEAAIDQFTGGAPMGEGGLTLTAPEIAENGNSVPVSVSCPGAVSIVVFASGNPSPDVCQFNFGPLAATQTASTRIRLATTQDVVAIAKMADGSFVRATANVKVTIGGCGG